MLLNYSNNSTQTQELIEKEVGKAFDLKTRKIIGGEVGS